MDACDLCQSKNLVSELLCPNAKFRGVRKVCNDCAYSIDKIRMSHAYDAYKYNRSDWHERLCRNVKRDLKKLYRKLKKEHPNG